MIDRSRDLTRDDAMRLHGIHNESLQCDVRSRALELAIAYLGHDGKEAPEVIFGVANHFAAYILTGKPAPVGPPMPPSPSNDHQGEKKNEVGYEEQV